MTSKAGFTDEASARLKRRSVRGRHGDLVADPGGPIEGRA
jgi:hypothetical protein